MRNRTYSELLTFPTFEERFRYLSLDGIVGDATFGGHRLANQRFYRSVEWKRIRNHVILRDNGCDLGIIDRPILGTILIHHINPIKMDDFRDMTEFLTNPEYLICVSHQTHNALHYGNEDGLVKDYVPRRPNDTCPWR